MSAPCEAKIGKVILFECREDGFETFTASLHHFVVTFIELFDFIDVELRIINSLHDQEGLPHSVVSLFLNLRP